MSSINDAIYADSPCDLCFGFGYACCVCTLGLSFCCPYICMNQVKQTIRYQIKNMNPSLAKKGLKMQLRQKCGTSWIELRAVSQY